jgi:hypothetical protein
MEKELAGDSVDDRVDALLNELLVQIELGARDTTPRFRALQDRHKALYKRKYGLSVKKVLSAGSGRPTAEERAGLDKVTFAHGQIAGVLASFGATEGTSEIRMTDQALIRAGHIVEIECQQAVIFKLARKRGVPPDEISDDEIDRFIFCS